MSDIYSSFNEIKQSEDPRRYKIESNYIESPFLIFAPHGGGIEPGTSEICKEIASNIYSHYDFNVFGSGCGRFHLTSTKFDEPILLQMLKNHDYAISIHGMSDRAKNVVGGDIYIGGLNIDLIKMTTQELTTQSFSATNNIITPSDALGGDSELNITNKCLSKKGMQIELSASIRKEFFTGNFNTKAGRTQVTGKFNLFCTSIIQTINIYERTLAKNLF